MLIIFTDLKILCHKIVIEYLNKYKIVFLGHLKYIHKIDKTEVLLFLEFKAGTTLLTVGPAVMK